MLLAVESDVTDELGRPLTADEAVRAPAILGRVTGYVVALTRRRYTPGPTTARLVVIGPAVVLDDATSVTAVRVVGADGSVETTSGYTLRTSTLYGLSPGLQVEVDYVSAGTVPAELRGVVAAIAARELSAPSPGTTTTSVGQVSQGYGGGYQPTLTAIEEAVLGANTLGGAVSARSVEMA